MKDIFIFVCDRGFVHVGEAEISTDMVYHWRLIRGCCIRRWGTTKGLAELKNGPTEETVLDEVCQSYLPFRSVLQIISLTQKGKDEWKKKLSS